MHKIVARRHLDATTHLGSALSYLAEAKSEAHPSTGICAVQLVVVTTCSGATVWWQSTHSKRRVSSQLLPTATGNLLLTDSTAARVRALVSRDRSSLAVPQIGSFLS